ncbi:hypothetical protein [Neisseria musculi]|uniref:hypothetical protein n=1 Tax=Neisseria musculi TaxID=1815583 RepID=UPI00164C587C|nr:hypothetical protein [Neisseria musculi]
MRPLLSGTGQAVKKVRQCRNGNKKGAVTKDSGCKDSGYTDSGRLNTIFQTACLRPVLVGARLPARVNIRRLASRFAGKPARLVSVAALRCFSLRAVGQAGKSGSVLLLPFAVHRLACWPHHPGPVLRLQSLPEYFSGRLKNGFSDGLNAVISAQAANPNVRYPGV